VLVAVGSKQELVVYQVCCTYEKMNMREGKKRVKEREGVCVCGVPSPCYEINHRLKLKMKAANQWQSILTDFKHQNVKQGENVFRK